MIHTIRAEQYQDSADCRALTYQGKEGFLSCSFRLEAGHLYGVASDFGCGSWGLVTCLGGRGEPEYRGKFWINERPAAPRRLADHAGFVTEHLFPGVNTEQDPLTPRECIQRAVKLGNCTYSPEEIRAAFRLSEARFDRVLTQVSGEIWLISLAVHFALGKDLFCFPWLNEWNITRLEVVAEGGVIDFLRSSGKIILVPSSQRRKLRRYCDRVLAFEKGRVTFR